MAAQDPMMQKLIGQNPQAQGIMGALQAHIAEHVGFSYRNKIAAALGAPMPEYALEDGLPPEMEYQLSSLLAQAAPQVLAQSQAMVAQQQAQQNAQDPVLQAQMQELKIKQQDANTKEMKVKADAAAKADELAMREKDIQIKAAAKADELALREKEIAGRQQTDGTRMGIEIGKHHADIQETRAQRRAQERQAAMARQQPNKPEAKK
jgi:hypothetical protein